MSGSGKRGVLRFVPGLQVLGGYRRADFGPDCLAGFVMVLVLIPSVLAYAELAGSGPVGGIYAAIAGTVAYFLFATSRHMNVGPDGAVALLAGSIVLPLAGGDPDQALVLGAWLALLTGVVLVTAAFLRLGGMAGFLSSPVLAGYLTGAALVIVVSQWGKLFGIELSEDAFFLRIAEWTRRLPETHMETLLTGLAVIGVLFVTRLSVRRVPPLVPVFLVALGFGALIDFEAMGVSTIGAIRDTTPRTLDFSLTFEQFSELAIGALGLSLLIFPEGLLLSRAMAEKNDYAIDPDQEVFALGACNFASSAFLGFTIGGSQTRTLVGGAAGGRTQVANLVAAGLLVLFLVFAGDWIVRLPKVAIAAILVFTGFGLIDVAGMRAMFARNRPAGWVALTTAVSVVVVGVLPGILMGAVLSLGVLIREIARPHDALLGRRPGSNDLHDVGDDSKAVGIPGVVAYRFYGPLIFANVGFFIERLTMFIEQQREPVRMVILDARAIPSIDLTAVEKLRPFLEKLHEGGIDLAIAGANLPLRESRLAGELAEFFPGERIYPDIEDAAREIDHR